MCERILYSDPQDEVNSHDTSGTTRVPYGRECFHTQFLTPFPILQEPLMQTTQVHTELLTIFSPPLFSSYEYSQRLPC